MEPFALCRFCGQPIGVYERLTVVEGDAVRTSSLAREPALGRASERLFHETCAHRASEAHAHGE